MRLDNSKKDFASAVHNTAISADILDEYVEKDYWLFLILKQIFKNDKRGYVFKGGTSLSKCYHLINRFSEDIDISYSSPFEEVNSGEIKRKFKGITDAIKAVGLEIANTDKLRWNRYFNQFQCPYNSFFSGTNIEKKVVIELAAQTPSFPSEEKIFSSFIGDYFESIGRHDLVEQYELAPFNLQVQTLERTLVDKTFAICDYYIDDKCENHSRHLYDISKLLTKVNLNQKLADLFKEVRSYRNKISVCRSARDGMKLNQLIDAIIKNESFKKDYETKTEILLYENYPYETCKESLIKLKDFLKENETYLEQKEEANLINPALDELENNKTVDGEAALEELKDKYDK